MEALMLMEPNRMEIREIPLSENIGLEQGIRGQFMPIAVRGVEKIVKTGNT